MVKVTTSQEQVSRTHRSPQISGADDAVNHVKFTRLSEARLNTEELIFPDLSFQGSVLELRQSMLAMFFFTHLAENPWSSRGYRVGSDELCEYSGYGD